LPLTHVLLAIAILLVIKYILPTFHCSWHPSYKISSKYLYLNPRLNYNDFFKIQDGGRPLSWILDNLIMRSRSNWVAIFRYCTKFGAKMLLDAEIVAQNLGVGRNCAYMPILVEIGQMVWPGLFLNICHHKHFTSCCNAEVASTATRQTVYHECSDCYITLLFTVKSHAYNIQCVSAITI